MSEPSTIAGYSIAAVSKFTGVSCHALRVWERRYHFPVPYRSASGHRRYSREQVQTLRMVAELSKTGRAIGDLLTAVREGRIRVETEKTLGATTAADPGVGAMVDQLMAGEFIGGENRYEEITSKYDILDIVVRVIEPAIIEAGERRYRRECEVFQDTLVNGFLRRKLEVLIDHVRSRNKRPARTIIVGTVQGDRHAGAVLIVQLLLELAGWRVLNLGVDVPVREYRKAVEMNHPDALALSFVLARNINKRFRELSQITEVPVFVGGRSILNYQRLARRHNLIPIVGKTATLTDQLMEMFDVWTRLRHTSESIN